MHSTPVSLLERLGRPHDQQAWERFVQLYTPLLCHWARRLEMEGQDAADLVQDVFTLLVQKLPTFHYDPGKRFRGWLWTVTLNCRRARLRSRGIPLQIDAAAEMQQTITPDAAAAVAEEEYRQFLTRRAMELMQTEFRPATWKAFWETVVNERPAAEVAAELGLTENAVYLAKGRVMRSLRQELAGLLD
ncbi:MAG TPA: sigma-70 family RNA polymerase sigma factor [Gemmataceae bacterium]|nr:sigma-70 family RNA polymerase sigma factor [Gemmataceae bacterium]